MPTVSWGLLDVEDADPETSTAAGDPLLTKLLEAFKAVINARLTAPWQAVHKNTKTGEPPKPVMYTFAYDPTKVGFNASSCPALYLFRSRMPVEKWLALDEFISTDTLTLLWIHPTKSQTKEAAMHPMVNAVKRTIASFLHQGADPAWVVLGDTDALSATRGSLLLTQCSLWAISLGAASIEPVKIDYVDSGERDEFRALSMEINVQERRSVTNSDLAESKVTATVETTDDDPLVNVEFTA